MSNCSEAERNSDNQLTLGAISPKLCNEWICMHVMMLKNFEKFSFSWAIKYNPIH